jgi:hypothetical protein
MPGDIVWNSGKMNSKYLDYCLIASLYHCLHRVIVLDVRLPVDWVALQQ